MNKGTLYTTTLSNAATDLEGKTCDLTLTFVVPSSNNAILCDAGVMDALDDPSSGISNVQGSYKNYKSITLPQTFDYDGTTCYVRGFRSLCFYDSSLESIDFSACTLNAISPGAFYGAAKLKSLDFSRGIATTGIGVRDYLCYGCKSLESVTLSSYFYTSYTKDNGTTSIYGKYAFYGCSSLKSINLSDIKTSNIIPDYMFSGCSVLESFDFPTSLTSIGESAFSGCSALKSADLSACTSLTSISASAFDGCSVLEKIKLGVESLDAYNEILSSNSSTKILVPPFSLSTYTGSGWGTTTSYDIRPYVDATVSSVEVSTLCLPFEATIPDDVEAYTVGGTTTTDGTTTATITEVETTTLAAGTPALVWADAATYEFVGTSGSLGTDSDGNTYTTSSTPSSGLLVGSFATDGTSLTYSSSDTYTNYVLQNQDGVKFYKVGSSGGTITVPQFKAYMQVSNSGSSSAEYINFDFSDAGVTAVSALPVATAAADGAVYTLQGVRADAANLPAGIYIKEGKKFVVK